MHRRFLTTVAIVSTAIAPALRAQTSTSTAPILSRIETVDTRLNGKVRNLTSFGAFVDIGNDIEGLVPVSQLNFGNPVDSPADMTWEGMKVGVRVLEVDPIQRRIVLAVTNIPEGQERPETPSKVIPMESDDYNLSDPIPIPIPATFEEPDA